LLHYVRTGDFVAWMLRDAQSINEFAFALGALSHYAADSWGHPAVNSGVGIEYPQLAARYGKVVTYEENPEAHLKTEFSFDVVQVAKQRYTGAQYHNFIGFEVSQDLMNRAFRDTYGVDIDDMLHTEDLSIGTFRFAIGSVIPEMTQVAVASRKDNLHNEKQDQARSTFLYHLSRADYEKDFGTEFRRPGIFARILAFLLKLFPKFGAFKALAYRDPTPQTEDLYFKSMNNVVAQYHRLVQQVSSGNYQLPNRNLDVGNLSKAGDYELADKTYAGLARRLSRNHFAYLTPALKMNIQAYFASGPAMASLGRARHGTKKALVALKNAVPMITPEQKDAFKKSSGR
jgi:Zinc dependent phospholipase C